MGFVRLVVAVVAAGGLAAGAAGASPPASGSPSGPVVAAPAAAPAPVISGVVRAADTGRPIGNVNVLLLSTVDPKHYEFATTDATGRYRTRALRPGGEYLVSFTAPDNSRYLSQEAGGAPSRYQARRYRAPAVVNASLQVGVRVSGRVTSSTGAASRGADVAVVPLESSQPRRWSTTDRWGRWSVLVPPGRYRVLSLHPSGSLAGFYPGSRSVVGTPIVAVGPRGRTGVDLRQPAPTRLVVTVVAASDGRPVTDACVQQGHPDGLPVPALQGTHPAVDVPEGPSQPNCGASDGVYIVGVTPGQTYAEVTHRDSRYGPALTAKVRVAAGGTARVRVALGALAKVTGRIVDRVTGRPLSGCVDAEPVVAGGEVIGACAGPDGKWEMEDLAAGQFRVRYTGSRTHVPGWAPAADTVRGAGVYLARAGATTAVPPVRVARGGVLNGRVLDTRGRAVVGAGVIVATDEWWQRPTYTAMTDAAGRYRLTNVPVGPHKVQVVPPSYTGLGSAWVGGAGDAGKARAITVPAGRAVSAPDLRLRPGATLSVVFPGINESVVVEALDAQGRVVGQAGVRLPIRPGKAGRTITLTGLPATAVRVHAFTSSTELNRHSWFGGRRPSSAKQVALTAGRTVTVGVADPSPVGRWYWE